MQKSGEKFKRIPRPLKIEPIAVGRIIKGMAVVFKSEDRKDKEEPIEDFTLFCRNLVRRCITGHKEDGTVWYNAPSKVDDADMIVLRKRLMVHGYNMDTETTVKRWSKRKKREHVIDGLPKESDIVSGRIKYGSSINQVLTDDEEKAYTTFKKKLVKDFPDLNTAVDEMGIEILAMIKLRQDRVMVEMAKSVTATITKDAAELSKLFKETTDSLGISGKQRGREKDLVGEGTVAELVKRYHNTQLTLVEEEHERYMQELQLFLAKFDRDEIEEVEVIRHTDLSIPKIREILIKRGIKVE